MLKHILAIPEFRRLRQKSPHELKDNKSYIVSSRQAFPIYQHLVSKNQNKDSEMALKVDT